MQANVMLGLSSLTRGRSDETLGGFKVVETFPLVASDDENGYCRMPVSRSNVILSYVIYPQGDCG